MVGAFPEAKAHINRCAEGFKRPAYLISRPKVRRTDANFALLRVSVSFTVTYFAPVDEKTATSDAEALEDAQDAILGLFDCGYLAVGDRKLTVTLSAGDPGADSVPVTVSLDYFEDRPMEAAGAKMGQALAEAQAIAANEYNATDGAQSQLESNKILAEDIKNDTSLQSEYYDAGYTMGEQFSKGYQSGIAASKGASTNLGSQGYNNWNFGGVTREKSSAGSTSAAGQSENFLRTHGYASGLDYVPYDNFPARLHLGEGVLTANENRQRKSGGVPAVTVTGNTFYVRQDSDIDAIASTIVNKMIAAKELAG